MIAAENSNLTIENYQARDITGRLIVLMNSTLAIAHSLFHSINAYLSLIDSTTSHISLLDVQWVNLTTNSLAGKLWPGSSWLISHSLFQDLHVTNEASYQILESSLTVHFSTFRNFGLFQCTRSNVTITKSRVENVRNPVKVLRSMAAYGGALSCLVPAGDSNSSALLQCDRRCGRSGVSAQGTLVVQNCTFAACSASQAGALFIQNMSFSIEHSYFLLNTAVHECKAFYAVIKPWQQGFIRYTLFYRNPASEGGAIKWCNAKIQLLNTTFKENSAS